MTRVSIPLPQGARRARYTKWSVRRSIDFPLVSVALRFDLDGDHGGANITDARVAIGVLNSKPRLAKKVSEVVGRPLSEPAVAAHVAELTFKAAKPLPNVPFEAPYRRKMVRVFTKRAIAAMAQD